MLSLRLFTDSDLALGIRLKTEAGWNLTEADWHRARALQPDGCFVAELDGVPVGTTTTCVFGSVAWVAMVLVDAKMRGRGIGTALMRHALAYLEGVGVRSIRLDATPLGRPVYRKLGFVEQFTLLRHAGTMPAGEAVSGIEAASSERYEELIDLDRTVTRTDRRKFLLRLFAEQSEAVRVTNGPAGYGFLTTRAGSNAVQVGPCLAAAADAGRLLFADAQHRLAGQPVYVDVPTDNTAATLAITHLGLTVQRPLYRMCLGEPVVEDVEHLWASSGAAKG